MNENKWIQGSNYLPAIAVVIVTVVAALLIDLVNLPITELIFVPAVLVVGLRWGLGPSITASVLSVLAYAALFSPVLRNPEQVSTHTIVHYGEVLIISVIVAVLASKARLSMQEARKREKIRSAVQELSHEVAVVNGMKRLTRVIVKTLRRILNLDVILLLPEDEVLTTAAVSSDSLLLTESDMEVARYVFRSGLISGHGAGELSNTKILFYPLLSAGNIVGVLGLVPDFLEEETTVSLIDLGQGETLLEALMVTIAAAIEREMFAHSAAEADMLKRHEELYTALLSSISHDFRTPLASIIGAAETLSLPGAVFSEETKQDMLLMVREEAQRLNRFVSNLLDMTKLEAGRLRPNLERLDLSDVIGTAIHRSERILKNRKVTVIADPSFPMIYADFVLLEHVLTNLLENAVKYSEAGTPIVVEVMLQGDGVAVHVVDKGKGIPAEALGKIFAKFYRVQHGDTHSAGTGLGLSICRGVIEAHGGRIYAESPVADGMGTRIVIELPVSGVPSETEAIEVPEL